MSHRQTPSRNSAAPRQGPLAAVLNTPSGIPTPGGGHGGNSTPRRLSQPPLSTVINPAAPRAYQPPPLPPSASTSASQQNSPAARGNRTMLLSSLGKCLTAKRVFILTRALATWRLSLSHILRHQSLLRLQSQSQAQQQSLAALRRSLPASAAPRPGHPSGAGSGAHLTPAQQATHQGSALLRDALLSRLHRFVRLFTLCRSLGRWRLVALAMGVLPLSEVGGGALRPGGVSATAPRALKRASAQEAAISSLTEKLRKSEAAAEDKARQLVLTQRQLATAVERRRVAEAGGKSAHDALARLQLERGREAARESEVDELRAAELSWALEGSARAPSGG